MRSLALLACLIPALLAATDLPEPTADERRSRDRLLHLAHGGVLRAPARRTADTWEFQRDGTWTPLPADAVVEVRLERDVLVEYRRRGRGVREPDDPRRVETARWCLAQGLLTEGFTELDTVLGASPDDARARAVLADAAALVAVPRLGPDGALGGGLETALAFAGVAPPSLRELLVLDLEAHADEALRAALTDELLHRDAGRRAFAALALRRLFELDDPAPLQRRALVDAAPDVRRQASLSLATIDDAEASFALIEALGSHSTAIRTHAAEALATLREPLAVESLMSALLLAPASAPAPVRASSAGSSPRSNVFIGRQRAFVQSIEAEVAQNAAIGNPVIGTLQEGAVLDVRVLGAGALGGYGPARETAALQDALRTITGADPGRSRSAWERWWERNRAEWPELETRRDD